mmetsp:Transcript_1666/g.3912  ORF Transcript_1666/g.3912 Transcript_1666/m.3912 type:complete len:88 (+) Transcript_1666:954-1217(+)|eukprot:CAMPEP_0171554888 /NCGR_PEP_ID=MMETSP0960-20121227/9792_1 /TAXON_ID=87120 /ORGANISM="Aurantiochytrium limacinum, Strain ATCCMYA-1381" /LENGTH=87 /DNA_ID=CAMNT_0012104829 /DNA_START=925 /DNA_END=1188 /DNA_ORIENTATION=-
MPPSLVLLPSSLESKAVGRIFRAKAGIDNAIFHGPKKWRNCDPRTGHDGISEDPILPRSSKQPQVPLCIRFVQADQAWVSSVWSHYV